ncbi:hypothetical protein [Streptomyces flavofungini]|uniref:Serine-threonine protein kinase n=1 Tax=Streptomyces flavofungini TaxID=68200 RepID=A0ABS0X6Y7_9ACTN|nr:hypothetical protein [Streptomyces flavofungini]MBJ3808965.1 hypothetical protein [Streptomyces flavofungini]GHC67891.1 hypothetical protein GCM10010349_41300 [Streptomyces flavofungini]
MSSSEHDPESARPRWAIQFDADGTEADAEQCARVADAARAAGIRHLVLLAHTAHNDADTTADVDARFRALFTGGTEADGVGFVSVHWPGMRFAPEPRLTDATESALHRTFPGRDHLIADLCSLVGERPRRFGAVDDVGMMLRRLVEAPLHAHIAAYATDLGDELLPQSDPAMLFDSTAHVCEGFARALAQAHEEAERAEQRPERIQRPGRGTEAPTVSRSGTLTEAGTAGPRPADAPTDWLARPDPLAPSPRPFGSAESERALDRLWDGAHQLLCQATSYAIRRRAGLIGETGLAPALGRLAEALPDTRIHLVGHGAGARLVAYAARGHKTEAGRPASMTLLQAALSHFAFAAHLPQQMRGGGALAGVAQSVAGPVVCAYSHHDLELGLLFPLATRMIGESPSLVGADRLWGALGYDGVQGVDHCPTLTLADALAEDALPSSGYVSVDASAVVRDGVPPQGAHFDVFHPELARLVLAAGQVRR